ncbi:DUF1501 domain-containing protein [Sphingomonas colocasiae]|uniref:DUF1501 domain-containing protein n=1 Tax=Sphingomonas colocasiae TaxID=1848973 RepID=A0ABS7PX83_9SPHN|nr:DUF1501 domain-containing protein [Sphingomonas colocasiae]MBY8825969.1 DUF1501 domain-containing protein [Sphingomonas colocasiae]
MIDRRALIGSAMFGAGVLAFAPAISFAAAPTDRRFVFIIQRGAADGLAMVAPIGDPAFAGARGALAEVDSGARLDATFSLHPALAETARLYAAGEALFGHALASSYRDRSHFDGQNILETGGRDAYVEKTGWMNRLAAMLPGGEGNALAIARAVPMALRGPVEVASYAPSALPGASEDLLMRVGALYEGDARLHALWQSAMQTRLLASDLSREKGRAGQMTGALAARLMAPADGARLVMIETGGWDTHSGQKGRLAQQLGGLDAMIAALKAGLGQAWTNTMILVATEFGRTVAVNGTGGTDHGTGAAAMLLGGAVRGGRVLADWPGLRAGALYEGRDLRPTLQLESFVAGALASHYGLDSARMTGSLYPTIAGLKPTDGLARA